MDIGYTGRDVGALNKAQQQTKIKKENTRYQFKKVKKKILVELNFIQKINARLGI